MKFLNINLKGLNGRPHPCLYYVENTRDAQKVRSHLKFLCSDIYTYEKKAKYQGGSPICRLCSQSLIEDIPHVLLSCTAYREIRNRILTEMIDTCETLNLNELFLDEIFKVQFILDCTSINLSQRISPESDVYPKILKLSRDLCFGILKIRTEHLKLLQP